MIEPQVPIPPSAIQMLQNKREKPDWTFGRMDQRATLTFGGKQVSPDDPQYELIKKLILQKYMNELYGH